MANQNIECLLVYKSNLKELLKKIVHLPHKKQTIIGRGLDSGIKDLQCSKEQLILEADTSARHVKVQSIGTNPSYLSGFEMEKHKTYFARPGMTVHITRNIEITFIFRNKDRTCDTSETEECAIEKQPNFSWDPSHDSVLFCQTKSVPDGQVCKIAGFDLDGTLICTKSGYVFPTNDDDWKLWHPCVKEKLENLLTEKFNLVMFTNQAHLETASQTKKESFKKKIENVVNALGVPFSIVIAKKRDVHRKPAPGMWDYYLSKIDGKLDLKLSFFVGDAAGRLPIKNKKKSGDFDITDRLFARNVGVNFYTPEEFFLNEAPRNYHDVNFHPHQLPIEPYPELGIPSNPPEVIIMVGSPASGKSYFIRTVLEPKGYIRVSRDEETQWTRCRDKIINAISCRKNCVYDATNPDKESRNKIIQLCSERKFTNLRCFLMTTPEDRCIHNNRFRQLTRNSDPVPHTAIVSFNKRYVVPNIEEGFNAIVKVPFVPNFQSCHSEELYKKYLLGKKS